MARSAASGLYPVGFSGLLVTSAVENPAPWIVRGPELVPAGKSSDQLVPALLETLGIAMMVARMSQSSRRPLTSNVASIVQSQRSLIYGAGANDR